MIEYNPDERLLTPTISLPAIKAPKLPLINVFGSVRREDYVIVETDEPYLLWESGAPMLWEDGDAILLEQQKERKWLTAKG